MWFILHTGTPGCEHVMSIDFDRALAMLPEQDDVIEPEFEAIDLPLHTDVGPADPPPSPTRYATVLWICAELGIDPPVGTKSLGGASPHSH